VRPRQVTVAKGFTSFELGMRYGFLVATMAILLAFAKQMNRLSSQMWGYQQKWILILLVCLVLFDGIHHQT
jgi:hypothetical protein